MTIEKYGYASYPFMVRFAGAADAGRWELFFGAADVRAMVVDVPASGLCVDISPILRKYMYTAAEQQQQNFAATPMPYAWMYYEQMYYYGILGDFYWRKDGIGAWSWSPTQPCILHGRMPAYDPFELSTPNDIIHRKATLNYTNPFLTPRGITTTLQYYKEELCPLAMVREVSTIYNICNFNNHPIIPDIMATPGGVFVTLPLDTWWQQWQKECIAFQYSTGADYHYQQHIVIEPTPVSKNKYVVKFLNQYGMWDKVLCWGGAIASQQYASEEQEGALEYLAPYGRYRQSSAARKVTYNLTLRSGYSDKQRHNLLADMLGSPYVFIYNCDLQETIRAIPITTDLTVYDDEKTWQDCELQFAVYPE